MGKTGRKNKTYSTEFKVNVIMDMREHHMGYRETARKYSFVRQSEASAANMVQRWERIYLEEGAEGLMKERRGRACSASGTRKGRQPKLDKKVEEDLIAENQRLRMEIEYLRLYRIIIFVQSRREFFVRLCKLSAVILDVFQAKFVQYDGKDASKRMKKAQPVIVRYCLNYFLSCT